MQDLAAGHVAAVRSLLDGDKSFTVNLGAGHGHSVLEVLHAFEEACGQSVPYRIAPRRSGDVAGYFADASEAKRLLGWRASRDLADMCADEWRWQQTSRKQFNTADSRILLTA